MAPESLAMHACDEREDGDDEETSGVKFEGRKSDWKPKKGYQRRPRDAESAMANNSHSRAKQSSLANKQAVPVCVALSFFIARRYLTLVKLSIHYLDILVVTCLIFQQLLVVGVIGVMSLRIFNMRTLNIRLESFNVPYWCLHIGVSC